MRFYMYKKQLLAQINIECIAHTYSVVALVDRHILPHLGSP